MPEELAIKYLEQLGLREETREFLKGLVSSLLKEIDVLIDGGEKPRSLYQASRHILGRGKMLRPLITLMVSEACGGEHEKAIKLALAAELLHTASLIHDDIIDDAETRRGVKSVHKKFGVSTAIVAGDLLISLAVKITADLGPRIIGLMSEAAERMSEGEILEMESRGREITLEEYLKIIEKKTASLIEAATASAAILSGASEDEIRAYGDYGRLIGLSLQVRDDILDVIGKEEFVGKPLRKDHLRGHTNIVYVLANRKNIDPNKADEIIGRGVIDEAHRIGQDLAKRAIESLSFLENEKRETFEEIAAVIISRMV